MYVWPYFHTWLPFLAIRRSKTPILHQTLGLFFGSKISPVDYISRKTCRVCNLKQLCKATLYKQKKWDTICYSNFSEGILHVCLNTVCYFQNGLLVTMETAEHRPLKLMKRKKAWNISISQKLSQIRNFRLSTLLWANARCLQSAFLKSFKQLNISFAHPVQISN